MKRISWRSEKNLIFIEVSTTIAIYKNFLITVRNVFRRLMGELFMRGQMFKTVMKTIDTFMHIHNAHSLECICVLLTIIGPEFEKVIWT
jgi:hypothetical protein